ncbi:hypothetical protein J4526_00845 [Desulfurococcaceae archaeon MEX13E-LK6-19]|nr:hypothetical protein J4526_00845 [Desulfurococcaceae archaeon MEX13E-LK6-19]
MDRGLIIVIAIGLLIAILPILTNIVIPAIESMVSSSETTTSITTTTSTTSSESEGIITVLKEIACSNIGSDRLEVTPGAVLVKPGSEFKITIRVYFRHSQPCPYSSWRLEYSVSGGVEVINDTGNKLVDSRTLVRELIVKANSNGTVTVTFFYGQNCPFGDKEEVNVEIYVKEE